VKKARRPFRRRAKRRAYNAAMSPAASLVRRMPEPRVEIDPVLSWYVVRTAVRAEGRVKTGLRGAALGVFLPAFTEEHERRGKTRLVRRSLFPRYLFVGLDRNQFEAVRAVDGVESVLSIAGCPVPVRADALQLVADTLAEHSAGDGRPEWTLRVGDTALVLTGPFAQFTATIAGEPKDGRVATEIAIFGRKTPVELAMTDVEAA
jgi:transcription antitermination factor NusG